MNHTLHFDSPTDKYTSGLPIGNGVIAAMVVDGPEKTRFALNHEGLWRTEHRYREVPRRADRLPEIRALIEAGDYEKATQKTHEAYSHYRDGSAKRNMPYVPAGDLILSLDTGKTDGYTRTLDLKNGVVHIAFDSERCGHVEMQAFISLTRGFGIIRVQTERGAAPVVDLSRTDDSKCIYQVTRNNERIEMNGTLDGSISFLVAAHTVRTCENSTVITFGIDVGFDKSRLSVPLAAPDFDALLTEQNAEFQKRLGNADITLELPQRHTTTDRRIADFREGNDASLPLLFFHYGKYLMVSGSGQLPHNLQGKWNEEIAPPWECDYHLDINLQMNYWFTDVLGMGYANLPLFDWCESCVPRGREMAENLYGCRGICFSISTDLWGSMFHDAFGWNVWNSAAPWLAQHFYRHYLYTGDVVFLKDRAYPFIKECCEFLEDYVVDSGSGLHILPSCSPENRFEEAGKLPISICADCAMDIALYRELLQYADQAANVLGVDVGRWSALARRLPELKITGDGRLMEWDKEYTESEPQHRHISHLVGYYPGWLVDKKSKLERACEASLDYRLSFGGGQTGWSRAWVACIYARLGRKESLWESIKNLITEQCSPSLLDFHPPSGKHREKIFQIDGNFGGTAAICEALVSVRYNSVELAPALPHEWPSGRVSHFKLPYDTDISFDFHNGKVTNIELWSSIPHTVELIVAGNKLLVDLPKEQTVRPNL